MPDNLTTYPIPYDSEATALYWRDRGFCLPAAPAAPDPDVDEPDDPQQAELPTGPTHVAARRSSDQLASASAFLAAAGRVTFDRGRATLKAVWMSVAYYASLGAGPERVCFAQVETLANRALVSKRTVRYHLVTLAALGLIHTDNRTGGYSPTHWSIPESSPSVLGGKDCRGGRQGLPGGAARVATEVSNRSSAPTEQELLASKQQPDGACAPPSTQNRKDPPQETKREQPTQTAEPTQAPAQGKTDRGGETRGASDKQIKYLHVLADKVGTDATHVEFLWREADPKRLQAQIKAAKPVKDRIEQRGEKHTHAVDVEAVTVVGNGLDDDPGVWKSCVQRCTCGAARAVLVNNAGVSDESMYECEGWKLVGHIVNYESANGGLVVTVTDEEQKNHDTGDDRIIDLTGRWRERQMPMSTVAALVQNLPEDGKGWLDSTVPVDRLDG